MIQFNKEVLKCIISELDETTHVRFKKHANS